MYVLQYGFGLYGEGEGISYGCSCLTNGDFDPLRAGSELTGLPCINRNGRVWQVNLRSVNSSDGRFLTGAEQGPMMNQGDGILELSWTVL